MKPVDKKIDMARAVFASKINPHGYSVFVLNPETGDSDVVYRGLEEEGRVEALRVLEENNVEGKVVIYHARYKTVGDINLENTHPFRMGDDGWLWHNGTMPGSRVFKEPDSKVVADTVAGGDIQTAAKMLTFLTNNRFVLFREGKIFLANEKVGEWFDDGCWYSKPQAFKNNIPLFVYGTLKKGGGNHYYYLSQGTEFGKAHTKDKYDFVTNGGFPLAMPSQNQPVNIPGEVYYVNDKILERIHNLEGYSPDRTAQECLYVPELTPVILEDGTEIEAWMYVNHKGDWENYTAIEEFEVNITSRGSLYQDRDQHNLFPDEEEVEWIPEEYGETGELPLGPPGDDFYPKEEEPKC